MPALLVTSLMPLVGCSRTPNASKAESAIKEFFRRWPDERGTMKVDPATTSSSLCSKAFSSRLPDKTDQDWFADFLGSRVTRIGKDTMKIREPSFFHDYDTVTLWPVWAELHLRCRGRDIDDHFFESDLKVEYQFYIEELGGSDEQWIVHSFLNQ